jgi:hypothetical protein
VFTLESPRDKDYCWKAARRASWSAPREGELEEKGDRRRWSLAQLLSAR